MKYQMKSVCVSNILFLSRIMIFCFFFFRYSICYNSFPLYCEWNWKLADISKNTYLHKKHCVFFFLLLNNICKPGMKTKIEIWNRNYVSHLYGIYISYRLHWHLIKLMFREIKLHETMLSVFSTRPIPSQWIILAHS